MALAAAVRLHFRREERLLPQHRRRQVPGLLERSGRAGGFPQGENAMAVAHDSHADNRGPRNRMPRRRMLAWLTERGPVRLGRAGGGLRSGLHQAARDLWASRALRHRQARRFPAGHPHLARRRSASASSAKATSWPPSPPPAPTWAASSASPTPGSPAPATARATTRTATSPAVRRPSRCPGSRSTLAPNGELEVDKNIAGRTRGLI